MLLLTAWTCNFTQAQLDTEFWFAAPEVWANHGDQPIVLRFSTLADAANVTVAQPANATFPVQSLAIPAFGTQTLNLTPWIDDIENTPFNSVLPQGLHIVSDAPITAYYEVNHQLNPDIFSLKGQSALGEAFYIPFQNYLNNGYLESKAGLDIVATEDNTEITIIPTQNLTGYPAGTPITITLDEGETYAFRAANVAANQHPSGTHVTSSAPIAITISDDSIVGTPYQGSCMDLLGDQAIPVSVAGIEYIAVKGNLNGPDKVFIVGTEDNTTLSVNGTYVWTLNAGETYAHTLSNPAAYYQASAPVVALHMTGFGCEVGGAILPPISCTGSNEVAFVRSSNDFIGMKILVPAGAEGDFTFNGLAANVGAVNFTAVPGTGGAWLYANITGTSFIPTGGASRLVNPTAKFHLGIINGGASSGTRYGYFSDFANYQHTTYTSDNQLCAGEIAELFATPILDATYNWTGPNGFSASGNEITIGPLDVDDAGLYVVSGSAGECEILPDTLELFVAPQPGAPDVQGPEPLCEGDAWELTALETADQWTWTNPAGEVIGTDSILMFTDATAAEAGTYLLTVESDNCLSESSQIDVVIFETLNAPLDDSPIEICEGSTLNLSVAQNVPNPVWEWTAPNGTVTSGPTLVVANTVAPGDAGVYTLGGTSNGCPLVNTSVEVSLSTPAPVQLTAPDFLCQDAAPFDIVTDDAYGGNWTANCANCLSNAGELSPANASPGWVEITYSSLNPCAQTATVDVEILAVPDASIEDVTFCEGTGLVALNANTGGGSWSSSCFACCQPNGLFDTGLAGVGSWQLTYALAGTCPSQGSATFTVTPNTSSAFTLAEQACANDEPLTVSTLEPNGQWTADCSNCISAAGVFDPVAAGPGVHTLTYTIPGVCGTATAQSIAVLSLPNASFTFNPSEGCAPALIACSAPVNPAIVDCQWTYSQNGIGANLPCTESVFVLENPGCYQLSHTVMDGSGCTSTSFAPELLCLSAPPSSHFTVSPAHPSLYDPLFEVWATDSLTGIAYAWEVAGAWWYDGAHQVLSIPEINEVEFNVCLEATDSVGCASLTCHLVSLSEGLYAYAPNAFTPDNDGHNDAWRMFTSGNVTRFEIQIFDRWGALVFSSEDAETPWIGNVQNGDHFAADGMYHFQAVLRDDAYTIKTLQGTILLIR